VTEIEMGVVETNGDLHETVTGIVDEIETGTVIVKEVEIGEIEKEAQTDHQMMTG
jgi:hypothetical protein